MTTIALPGIIDALISQLSAAAPLAGIRIFDGIEIDLSYKKDAIAIGDDGTDDGDVYPASAMHLWENLGATRMMEEGLIACTLWSNNGSTKTKARRDRAYTILSAIDTAIRSDVSLGGACLYAGLAKHETQYVQSDVGFLVKINFTVAYKART